LNQRFVIIIAALNLFLDFDRIEKGVEQKMPKFMEIRRYGINDNTSVALY
jgi:uncharacterized YccA/Bax inhibitor family protein